MLLEDFLLGDPRFFLEMLVIRRPTSFPSRMPRVISRELSRDNNKALFSGSYKRKRREE